MSDEESQCLATLRTVLATLLAEFSSDKGNVPESFLRERGHHIASCPPPPLRSPPLLFLLASLSVSGCGSLLLTKVKDGRSS